MSHVCSRVNFVGFLLLVGSFPEGIYVNILHLIGSFHDILFFIGSFTEGTYLNILHLIGSFTAGRVSDPDPGFKFLLSWSLILFSNLSRSGSGSWILSKKVL